MLIRGSANIAKETGLRPANKGNGLCTGLALPKTSRKKHAMFLGQGQRPSR